MALFQFLFLEGKPPRQAALNLIECCAGMTLADHAALTVVIVSISGAAGGCGGDGGTAADIVGALLLILRRCSYSYRRCCCR